MFNCIGHCVYNTVIFEADIIETDLFEFGWLRKFASNWQYIHYVFLTVLYLH